MSFELEEEYVQVLRADLKALIKEFKEVKEKIEANTLDNQLNLLCGASRMLSSANVCTILGFSNSSMNRLRDDETIPIPMIKCGRDWIISRELFTSYYTEIFIPHTKNRRYGKK